MDKLAARSPEALITGSRGRSLPIQQTPPLAPSEATHRILTLPSWPQDPLVLPPSAQLCQTCLTPNLSRHHRPLESAMKQCPFSKSVSFHRTGGLSVCVSSQVPGWQLVWQTSCAIPPCVIGSGTGRWVGEWTTGKLAGHTDQRHSLNFLLNPVLTPLLYHLFLPHLPLPHRKPRNISFLLLQSGPGARVTNARPGLAALFCPFSFFHCFTRSPVSSAVHVRFPRAMGPLPGGGGALGKVWEVCGTQGQEHAGGWRLNSRGGRNREGGGKWEDWWEERASSHKIQTNPTSGKSTTDHSTFQTRVLLLQPFSILSISCMVKG